MIRGIEIRKMLVWHRIWCSNWSYYLSISLSAMLYVVSCQYPWLLVIQPTFVNLMLLETCRWDLVTIATMILLKLFMSYSYNESTNIGSCSYVTDMVLKVQRSLIILSLTLIAAYETSWVTCDIKSRRALTWFPFQWKVHHAQVVWRH